MYFSSADGQLNENMASKHCGFALPFGAANMSIAASGCGKLNHDVG
jgi:hypothetical protein